MSGEIKNVTNGEQGNKKGGKRNAFWSKGSKINVRNFYRLKEKATGYKVFWLSFEFNKGKNRKQREGKFYVPEHTSSKLVCFYSGSPGANLVSFEKKFSSTIVKNGYNLWVPRHNGMKINETTREFMVGEIHPYNNKIINSKDIIGSKISAEYFKNLLNEPLADLIAFNESAKIKEIILIGHCVGSVSAIHSINALKNYDNKKIIIKIKKFISLSGFFPDSNERVLGNKPGWGFRFTLNNFMDDTLRRSKRYFNFNRITSLTRKKLKDGFKKNVIVNMNHPGRKIPDNIDLIFVLSPVDPMLKLTGGKRYFNFQNRGLFIHDLTSSKLHPLQLNKARIFNPEFKEANMNLLNKVDALTKKKYGLNQHSLPNLLPETLMRLINIKISGKHSVILRKGRILIKKQKTPRNTA